MLLELKDGALKYCRSEVNKHALRLKYVLKKLQNLLPVCLSSPLSAGTDVTDEAGTMTGSQTQSFAPVMWQPGLSLQW